MADERSGRGFARMNDEPPRTSADRSDARRGSVRPKLLHADTTGVIIAAFYRVYDTLGAGFLESVYANALTHELRKRGVGVEREVAIQVWYDRVPVGVYRADVLVNGCVVVELKATRSLSSAAYRQLLNYLRGTELQVGLLLHFGPTASFRRVVATGELSASRSGPR
jgi:GxxExxY protein